MQSPFHVVFLLFSLFLLGCGDALNHTLDETWEKPVTSSIGCSDYFSEIVPNGVLYNNVWNKHAAGNAEWEQCLESRLVEDEVQYGWSWQWPMKSRTVFGYPQIKVGLSPWAPEPVYNQDLPNALSNISTLSVEYDIQTESTGDYNLAFTLWLTDGKVMDEKVDKANINTEFMIWMFATEGHFNPAGQKQMEVVLDNKTWEVWQHENWGDDVNDNKWRNITYRAKQGLMTDKLDILLLLQHSQSLGLIKKDYYVSDLELGNEIKNGSGISWVNDFNVIVE